MDDYRQANQRHWDQLTAEHEQSPFYDLAGFKSGMDRLRSIELSELGDVINDLIDAGLRIEFVHELPFAARAKFPFMKQGEDGWWRLPAGQHATIPFLFSLQARKES